MTAEILSKLETMDSKLDKLVTWKAVHEKEHETVNRDLDETRVTLYGEPGQRGLQANVESLLNCKKSVSRWRDFWMAIVKIVAAAVIIAAVAWAVSLYKSN